MKAGRASDAETVYRDDLRRHPENGWALFGLAQSVSAQGRNDEAILIQERYAKAWKNADTPLKASSE